MMNYSFDVGRPSLSTNIEPFKISLSEPKLSSTENTSDAQFFALDQKRFLVFWILYFNEKFNPNN